MPGVFKKAREWSKISDAARRNFSVAVAPCARWRRRRRFGKRDGFCGANEVEGGLLFVGRRVALECGAIKGGEAVLG